jgi:hypothetical protein
MPLAIVGFMAGGILWVKPSPLPLREHAISQVGSLLGIALVISIFLERAIEVFISVWRNPDAARLDVHLEQFEHLIKETDSPKEKWRMRDHLDQLKVTRARYKVDTQTLAMWVSFFSGLLISVAGLRCLETLVVAEKLASLSDKQQFLFRMVDVLLTGGLIAGGSEGLHKISQVYTTFIDTTKQRLRDSAPPTPPCP